MDRRGFVRLCSSALALVTASPAILAQNNGTEHRYNRVRLTGMDDKPVKASSLQPGQSYLFHYPYAGTPCFLINLGKPVSTVTLHQQHGQSYEWPGGVGKDHSIVAFSAICSHQLSYPSRIQSFINYQHGASTVAGRSQVIVCCAHHSVYDPAQGAKVIFGPSTTPLTTIVLEHDTTVDELYAIGVLGSDKFLDFFRAYKRELIREFGRGISNTEVTDTARVVPAQDYTQQQIRC